MKTRWLLGASLLAAGLAGCGTMVDSESAKHALSGRERDSVLAQSALPGAGTVDRALTQSDRAAERAAGLDSLTR